jgi:ribose transport system substrate-binding protein
VAGDNPGLGRVSAEYMVEALGGQGKIVVLRGIPTVIDNQRFDAFMEVVAGTNIEVLDSQYANWNRDDGFEVMQDFLTRFPEIDAVWAQDDDIALGVIEALAQAGTHRGDVRRRRRRHEGDRQARHGRRPPRSPSTCCTRRP